MDEESKLLRRRDSDPRPGQGSGPWVARGALIQGKKKERNALFTIAKTGSNLNVH